MKTSQSLKGQAVILEPSLSGDNVIQPLTDSVSALTLRQHSPTQSAPLLVLQDSLGVTLTGSAANAMVGGLPGLPLVATKTITAVQLKNLVASPVTIIPAPGLGVFVYVLRAMAEFVPGSEALADGAATFLSYGDASNPFGTALQSATIQDTAGHIWDLGDAGNGAQTQDFLTAAVSDQPVVWAIRGVTDFTGNVSNDALLILTVYYTLINV